MALPPKLNELKELLEGASMRTDEQEDILKEIKRLDHVILWKQLDEANITRMTSPNTGACPCCGR